MLTQNDFIVDLEHVVSKRDGSIDPTYPNLDTGTGVIGLRDWLTLSKRSSETSYTLQTLPPVYVYLIHCITGNRLKNKILFVRTSSVITEN